MDSAGDFLYGEQQELDLATYQNKQVFVNSDSLHMLENSCRSK